MKSGLILLIVLAPAFSFARPISRDWSLKSLAARQQLPRSRGETEATTKFQWLRSPAESQLKRKSASTEPDDRVVMPAGSLSMFRMAGAASTASRSDSTPRLHNQVKARQWRKFMALTSTLANSN